MEWNFVGMTVAPKHAYPCMVWQNQVQVMITTVTGRLIGTGYFHTVPDVEHDRHGPPEELTGYPRVHTTPGVLGEFREMKSFGTALYTGLALVAKLNSEDRVENVSDYKEPGVSSWRPREEPAELWWQRAKERGDAEHVKGTLAREAEFEGSDADDDAKPELIPVEGFTGRKPAEVMSYEIRFQYGYFQEQEADIYTFDTANEKNLVLVMVETPKVQVWEPQNVGIDALNMRDLVSSIAEVNLPLFAALNVGFLRDEGANGSLAFEALFKIGKKLGLSAEELARLTYRYERGTDVEAEATKQEKKAVRRAPRRRTTARPNGIYQENSWRVKLYGARPNPNEPALLTEAQRLVEGRVDLGLDEYQDDV